MAWGFLIAFATLEIGLKVSFSEGRFPLGTSGLSMFVCSKLVGLALQAFPKARNGFVSIGDAPGRILSGFGVGVSAMLVYPLRTIIPGADPHWQGASRWFLLIALIAGIALLFQLYSPLIDILLKKNAPQEVEP